MDLVGRIFCLGFALRQKIEPALRDPEPCGLIGIAGSALKLFLRLPGIFPVFVVLRHGMTPSHAQMEPVKPTAQIADKIRFAISRPTIVASPRYLSANCIEPKTPATPAFDRLRRNGPGHQIAHLVGTI